MSLQAFVKKNPDFVASKLRVSEEILTKKMRLLTLMSMAEKKNVREAVIFGRLFISEQVLEYPCQTIEATDKLLSF